MTTPTRNLVGVLELSSKYKYGLTNRGDHLFLFRPYDEAEPEYVVGSSEHDLSKNQIAVVEVSTPAPLTAEPFALTKPRGSLQRLLGYVGDPAAEREALLLHYCPAKYKKDLVLPPVDTTDDEERIELDAEHGWITFHVDPPGCRDVDDAIAYNPDTGAWAITIADAAAAVPVDSPLDKVAVAIGSTFYDLEGRALKPMLPAAISEEAASLLKDQRRRGVTLIYGIDGSEDFVLSWITVAHTFTYESFETSALRSSLPLSAGLDAHLFIEQQMIRYNTAVACRLRGASAGLLRVQAAADAAALVTWSAIDPALALLANEAATYEVADATKHDQSHASLKLPAYCHASSPLRRYADLYNQRVLKALLRGSTTATPVLEDPGTPYRLATTLNQRTKANRRWTRDLTFLSLVTAGKVHTIDVVFLEGGQVWVPAWKRLLRLRHVEERTPGFRGPIDIFCDPKRRNWRTRVLTAPHILLIPSP
jgi:exoribonuclease R